ncbi:MAG: hypothetical protein M5U15_15080 [Kiritimatiellae bacterium]|nr:hypothetical protein [Kiritimatiellia bacterium]
MKRGHFILALGLLTPLFAWPVVGFGAEDRSIQEMMDKMAAMAQQVRSLSEPVDLRMTSAKKYIERKENLEALALLRELIKESPNDPAPRFMAANAFINLQRSGSARTLLEQMLVDYPKNAGLLNNLAWIYATTPVAGLKNPPRALDLARKAILISPDDYHIWSTLAEAHFASRNYSNALRSVEIALRLARESNASSVQIVTYEQQVTKCREAVAAFSIVE